MHFGTFDTWGYSSCMVLSSKLYQVGFAAWSSCYSSCFPLREISCASSFLILEIISSYSIEWCRFKWVSKLVVLFERLIRSLHNSQMASSGVTFTIPSLSLRKPKYFHILLFDPGWVLYCLVNAPHLHALKTLRHL